MTSLADLEATAVHYANRTQAELYREAGLQAGPIRIVALVGGQVWPPRLLLALDAKRRELPGQVPGSQDAQALLRSLKVPLVDRHLAESPLRTG